MSYVALGLLLRARMKRFRGNLWLDGVIASLAVAALGRGRDLRRGDQHDRRERARRRDEPRLPARRPAPPRTRRRHVRRYGWRVDRTWGLVAAGFAVFAITDSVYLYETAVGRYVEGGMLDVGWPAALVLIACSAWQPTRKLERVRTESWQALTLPTFFAVVGLGLLVYDHFVRINLVAFALASATIAAVIVRAVLTFRERVRLLATSREEALTDSLDRARKPAPVRLRPRRAARRGDRTTPSHSSSSTWTGSRHTTIHSATPPATPFSVASQDGSPPRPRATGARTGSAATSSASWPRRSTVGPGRLIERAAAALTEEGEGFSVRCSYGAVLMPAEASSLTEALRMADDRMYLHKQRSRPSAERQSIDVLVSVLNERDSHVAHHLADVADLAEAVSRRLDVPEPQVRPCGRPPSCTTWGSSRSLRRSSASRAPLAGTSGSSCGGTR